MKAFCKPITKDLKHAHKGGHAFIACHRLILKNQYEPFTIRGEWRDHSSMPQISTFEHSYNMNDWVSDTKYPEEIMNSTLPVSREETISIIAVPLGWFFLKV